MAFRNSRRDAEDAEAQRIRSYGGGGLGVADTVVLKRARLLFNPFRVGFSSVLSGGIAFHLRGLR